MQNIPMVSRYFGTGDAIVTEEFSDRWRRQSYRKRVSYSWLRKLRSQGVTRVALTAEGRTADFTVAELLRSKA